MSCRSLRASFVYNAVDFPVILIGTLTGGHEHSGLNSRYLPLLLALGFGYLNGKGAQMASVGL